MCVRDYPDDVAYVGLTDDAQINVLALDRH